MSDNHEFQKVSESEKIKIMKEIEARTEKIVITGIKTGVIENPINVISGAISGVNKDHEKIQNSSNILLNIMQAGANEFKEKVGREMTYSEMRGMYG
jgi:hypothetical protein